MIEYNILNIVPDTVVDGEGLRTAIYFAGCSLHCEGCHNPESWNFSGGNKMPLEQVINECEHAGHNKVTLTGGNPVEIKHMTTLCRTLKSLGYNIWLYTGWELDDLGRLDAEEGWRNYDILSYVDVVVDGPFKKELKKNNLVFRGSSNQQIWKNQSGTWNNITNEF